MTLPAWWQVATPHKDIREKNFSEAVFAADLGDVVGGKAPAEYLDPRLFFSRTYLTGGLKNLVQNVLSRLAKGKGDPVIQLQTPFGGGKTHSLLCLYHLVRSFGEVNHLFQVKELASLFPEFAGAKVAAFAGTAADVVSGRTPWGEIAFQLGCYDLVKEHDRQRVAPGKERIKEILEKAGPSLILMDELLQYIVKASQVEQLAKVTKGQTLSFLQELSEAVVVSEKCVLVLALPASGLELYSEEAEKALAQIQKVSGRVESIYVPVEGMEIYEVIRKRLLDDYGDKNVHKQVAESYFRLYQSLGNDAPGEVRDITYREKIEKAYPFHPELIDVLYERWGSFPTFQRTRGVLRLLARVVGDLYERKTYSPLIHSSLVNLDSQELRREFIKHIGNEYDSIITADISKKAAGIDQEIGSEYEKYGLAKSLATSVFLYSFSGGERKGITLPWLRTSLLREGIPSTIVGDAVSKLEDSLWYFHAEKRFYSFKNQPNLNRVIIDKEETLETWQITEELKGRLQPLLRGTFLTVFVWPGSSADIPDNKRLKLALLEPSYLFGDKDTESLAVELAKKSGASPRIYMNSLFILAADPGGKTTLEHKLRRYLALKDIDGDKNLSLTPNAREEVKTKIKEIDKDLAYHVLNTYRHIGWHGNGGFTWRDMGMPTAGQAITLVGRVVQYLRDEERVLGLITPKLLLDKTFGKEEQEKAVQDCYDLFFKIPGVPCQMCIRDRYAAIRKGCSSRLLGLKSSTTIYFGDVPPNVAEDDIILRPEKAEKEKQAQETKRPFPGETVYTREDEPVEPFPLEVNETGGEEAGTVIAPEKTKEISFKARIPWDKLSQLPGGVILPLKSAGSEPEITLQIRARSEGGFDRTTLDSKVRETLQQIGAEIEMWEEK